MPDDIEKVAEQPAAPGTDGEFVKDAGFEGGFDEQPAAPAAPEKPAEEPKPAEPPAEPAKEPTNPEEPAAPVEPELTDTQKKLIERSKRFAEGGQPPAPPASGTPPPVEPPKPAAEPPAAPAEGALSTSIAEILKLPGVAGSKIIVDGAEMTAEKFAEQYPEIVQAEDVFGTARVKKALADAGVSEMRAQIDNLGLLLQVQQEHPDVVKVVKSKEYQEWIRTQPPGVQKMEESMDPQDGIALLDAFKEHLARSVGAKAKEEAKKAKDKRTDLHSETVRGAQRPGGSAGPKTEEDEFAAGFGE